MLLQFRSARDLGLKTTWRYGFVPYGRRATTTPGVVYLDVGGGNDTMEPVPGVLDHHNQQSATESSAGYPSSAAIVEARPDVVYTHLLGPWLQRADSGQLPPSARWSPLLVTHVYPDWDSAVTAVLIEYLIEYGRLPEGSEQLIRYTNQVDQGLWRMAAEDDFHHPHLALLAAAHMYGNDHAGLFEIGRKLVRAQLAAGAHWAGVLGPELQPVLDSLTSQAAQFAIDRSHADLVPAFPLFDTHGRSATVPAFLLREVSVCALNKYFVRASGYPLFFCPYHDPRKHQDVVIISLDPGYRMPDGRKPSLKGLGNKLEQAEVKERKARNNGHDDRPGPPRWDDGSCTNSDPWYDGRAHGYSLVQTPDRGTVLPLAGIRAALEEADYGFTTLAAAAIRLIWRDPDPARLREHSRSVEQRIAGIAFQRVSVRLQGFAHPAVRYSRKGSPEFLVTSIDAPAGVGFEWLAAQIERAATAAGHPPDYKLVHVTPQQQSDSVRDLLAQLGDGRLQPMIDSSTHRGLFNIRNVLHLTPQPASPPEIDSEFEAVLYAAFLRESLLAVSDGLSTNGAGANASVKKAREEFLAFQTQCYKQEMRSTVTAQDTFNLLAGAMELPMLYEEVHAKLERWSEIEREAFQSKFEAVAFVLSVLSLLQTVTSYFGLDYEKVSPYRLAATSVAIPGLFLLLYLRIRGTLTWLVFGLLTASLLIATFLLGSGMFAKLKNPIVLWIGYCL